MENTHQRICGDRTLLTAHATPPFVKKKKYPFIVSLEASSREKMFYLFLNSID
jgi:hypothetical protein